MKFSNRCFAFYRVSGELISRMVYLRDDGSIDGISSPNEKRWIFENSSLQFTDIHGNTTTDFHTHIDNKGQLIFLGKFFERDKNVWHVLAENPWEYRQNNTDITNALNSTHTLLRQMNDTLGVGLCRVKRIGSVRKILFLIHNMTTWDSLADVYNHLMAAEDFEVIVASIRRRFPGGSGFSHETETHEELVKKGIDHIRLSGDNYEENIKLLKCIAPDGVFRQSPWDFDIPPEFSVENMNFTNLFYIPYFGLNIVESFTKDPNERDYQADQDFHRACSLVFCETEVTRQLMAQKSRRGGDHFVATGHPKLERLLAYKQSPQWPIVRENIYQKKLRIIWAPHHSIDGGWLFFGVFLEVYRDMLEWVKSDPNVEIVLKPHPALFSKLVGGNQLTQAELNDFREEWEKQPNATIVESGEYGPLLAASDIMLTDGISFLAEYMLFFEKPLIFMENPQHSPFNEIGRIIESACYITHGVEEARMCISEIMRKNGDYKINQRKATKEVLLPFEFGAAERIVMNLRKFFA